MPRHRCAHIGSPPPRIARPDFGRVVGVGGVEARRLGVEEGTAMRWSRTESHSEAGS